MVSNDTQEAPVSYSDKAVVFLDIIGFKNKVEKTKDNPSAIADIVKALTKAEEWLANFKGEAKEIHIQTFSDTTLICASGPTPIQLVSLISGIALYQCSMVLNGNVLRGAVAVGPNYQLGNKMFGPGIIEAYETELLADWPRVVVASSVLERVNPLTANWRTRPYILMDERGLAYVDYLMEGCLRMTANQWVAEYGGKGAKLPAIMPVLVSCHRSATLSLRDEAKESRRKLSRCHSLATYHNATIVRLNSVLAGWQDEDALGQPGKTPFGVAFPGATANASAEVGRAAKEFARAKLLEAPVLQEALKGLAIDLPAAFPVLYGGKTVA